MKIAMVSEHASPLAALGGVDAGGQNVHVAELASALQRQGHEVVVYTRRDSPDLPARVEMSGGVVVDHLDAGPPCALPKDELPPFIPDLAGDLTERLMHELPDVIHAHFWMSGLASLQAAAATCRPVVQTFHALGVVKRRFQGAADTSPVNRVRCERTIAFDATRVIASSNDERVELLRMGGDADRIDVIPSGVDLALFDPYGPRAGRAAKYRLVTISRLVPRKGVDDAIRVTAQLPDTELLVAGGPEEGAFDEDPEVQRLRELASDLGVRERVHLLGSVGHDRLAPLIRSADAVLCLPWYEPFGIVPLEAMACGVPVVASAVGGLLDTVTDGGTGLHVPPRDPATAAGAVRRLLADPAARAEMGRRGVTRAAGYAWDEIADRVARCYLDAVVGAPARPQEVAG
jgi:glycosyltransferase involved in cell wall biosynthesis